MQTLRFYTACLKVINAVDISSCVIADTKTIYKRFVVHVLIPDLFQFLVVEFFMCIADKSNRFLCTSLRVLTSFVPPVHNQGVSLAPLQGHALWKIFLPTTGSFFVISLTDLHGSQAGTLRWTFPRLLPMTPSLFCHGWIQLPASSAGGSIQP